MPCVQRSIEQNRRERTPSGEQLQLPEMERQHNQPEACLVHSYSDVIEVSHGAVGSIPLDESQAYSSNCPLTKHPADYLDTQDGICLDQNCCDEENNCTKQSPEKDAQQVNVKTSTQADDETLLNVIESVDLDQAVQLLKGNNRFSQDGLDRALISACYHGLKFMVKTLVRLGANVQFKDTLGNTPLLICAKNGFIDIVRFLLKKKTDVNASNSAGDTALILSLRPEGSLEMVKVLLGQNGIDISHQSRDGYTALMKAVEVRDVDVIKILMDRYIKEKNDGTYRQLCTPCCPGSIEAVNSKGMTAEEIADKCGLGNIYNLLKKHIATGLCPLKIAVNGSDIESLEILLDCHFVGQHVAGEVFLEIFQNCDYKEANAVTEDEIVIARKLLEYGAEVDTRRYEASYLLSVAVKMGDHRLVKLLCQHLDQQQYQWYRCDSQPLVEAVMFGHCDLINLLLEYKIDPNKSDDFSGSPLDCALSRGYFEIAKLLVQHGATMDIESAVQSAVEQQLPKYMNFLFENYSLEEITNDLKWDNSIHYLFLSAVRGGNLEIIGHLLDAGADVNCNVKYNTPLAECRSGDVARFLINRGANINFQLQIGYTLLLKIIMQINVFDRSCIDVLEVLLESGASVNEKGMYGRTPLMVAASSKENVCMLKVLLDHGANINDQDNRGNTALMEAVCGGCPLNVSFLLELHKEKNLTLNVQNSDGDTALMLAVRYYNLTILKQLIDFGADVNIKNYIGNTPLMCAAAKKRVAQEEIMTTLIHAGNDLNCQNNDGLSPLMLAARSCCKDAILVLLDSGADINAVSEKDSTKTALSFLSDLYGIFTEFRSCLRILLTKGACSSYVKPGLLHRMVVQGDIDVISELIRCGLGPTDVKLQNVLQSIVNNEVIPPVSPLCVALLVGNASMARYFVENLFLVTSDITSLTRNKFLRHALEMRHGRDCLNILNDLSSRPLSLFRQTFVAVSSAVGSSPGRENRVNMLPLPQVMKDKLLFRAF